MPALLVGPATLVLRVFKAMCYVSSRQQGTLQRTCTIHGIATVYPVQWLGYCLDNPGFDSRHKQNFQPGSGARPVSCSMSNGSSYPKGKAVGVWSFTTLFRIERRLKTSGAILPLPHRPWWCVQGRYLYNSYYSFKEEMTLKPRHYTVNRVAHSVPYKTQPKDRNVKMLQ